MKLTLDPHDIEALKQSKGGMCIVEVRGHASSIDGHELILFKGNVLLEDVNVYVENIEREAKSYFDRNT